MSLYANDTKVTELSSCSSSTVLQNAAKGFGFSTRVSIFIPNIGSKRRLCK